MKISIRKKRALGTFVAVFVLLESAILVEQAAFGNSVDKRLVKSSPFEYVDNNEAIAVISELDADVANSRLATDSVDDSSDHTFSRRSDLEPGSIKSAAERYARLMNERHYFRFNPATLRSVGDRIGTYGHARVALPLPPEINKTVVLTAGELANDGGLLLTGHLDKEPTSFVTLYLTPQGLLRGTIPHSEGDDFRGSWVYHIENVESSLYRLATANIPRLNEENDYATFDQLSQSQQRLLKAKSEARRQRANTLESSDLPDDGSTIDLLVVYTPEAAKFIGSNKAIVAAIEYQVELTNMAFQDSFVATELRLVHTQRIERFPERNVKFSQLPFEGDGVLDDLPALRNSVGADLVMVISLVVQADDGTDLCGLGAFPDLERDSAGNFGGYSWVSAFCVEGAVTFAHEIGHNLNGRHQRRDHPITIARNPKKFNFGFVPESRRYRTIMVTSSATSSECIGRCPRLHNFSTPKVKYKGAPLGLPRTSKLAADNGLAFNRVRKAIANYRSARVVKKPNFVATTDGAYLNRDNPKIHFSPNGTPVDAWQVVVRSNARSYATRQLPPHIRSVKMASLSRLQTGIIGVTLRYKTRGEWKKVVTKRSIVTSSQVEILAQRKWLLDLLKGWSFTVDSAAHYRQLLRYADEIQKYAKARDEQRTESSLAKFYNRANGCENRGAGKADANDWVRSCFAQEEMLLALDRMRQSANGLALMGTIHGYRGLCLRRRIPDVDNVVVSHCSRTPVAEEIWEFSPNGQLKNGDDCLSAHGNYPEPGKDVFLVPCATSMIPKWQRWTADGDAIVSLGTSRVCLSIEGPDFGPGAPVETLKCQAANQFRAHQTWTQNFR